MVKNKYVLYPENKLTNVLEIKSYCKKYFEDLRYKIKFLDNSDTHFLYLNIENNLFKVTLRMVSPKLGKYKIPIMSKCIPILGAQQLLIKKISSEVR
ncbi:MAG: hypothetical protein ACRCYE_14945 [Sarcina sp.]